jgi:hypothetical protein
MFAQLKHRDATQALIKSDANLIVRNSSRLEIGFEALEGRMAVRKVVKMVSYVFSAAPVKPA